MRYYIALLHKDPKSDYGVSFPDLPGCITAGRTLDEARAMPHGPERTAAMKKAGILRNAADLQGIVFAKRGRPAKT